MKTNNNIPSIGYVKKLRSQAPYYQASNYEILEDLELLNCPTDKNIKENKDIFDISLTQPKKRNRNIRKIDISDEDEAIEGLASLMIKTKPVAKPAKNLCKAPSKQLQNQASEPNNTAQKFGFNSLPFALAQLG